MAKAKGARVCIVGSITGNTNTVGGGLVYPQANLGDLSGFVKGGTKPISMADGKPFFGAKAYKDSKVRECTVNGNNNTYFFMLEFHKLNPNRLFKLRLGLQYDDCI